MPHQCTGCGHAFEDGSKEMLSGCPECGGNKFQFHPEGAPLPDDPDPPDDARDAAAPPEREERSAVADSGSVAETVGRATTKVRDFVTTNPDPAGDSSDASTSPDPERSWPSEADADAHAEGEAGSTGNGTDTSNDRGTDGEVTPGESQPAGGTDTDQQPTTDGEIIDADARQDERDAPADHEDVAQASARSDVVTNDELDDASQPRGREASTGDRSSGAVAGGPDQARGETAPSPGTDREQPGGDTDDRREQPDVDGDAEVVSQPSGDDPDLAELREQLNDQFESIKIVEPGQYELNLMELYDREEYIIALQENGRYVIQVPDQWIGDDLDDR